MDLVHAEGRRLQLRVGSQETGNPLWWAVFQSGQGDMGVKFSLLRFNSAEAESIIDAVAQNDDIPGRIDSRPQHPRLSTGWKMTGTIDPQRQGWGIQSLEAVFDVAKGEGIDFADKSQGKVDLVFRDRPGPGIDAPRLLRI